ncbi:phosphate acyltransferase PlsX [Pseudomonas sp. LTJR-52]|uniref:phosphate acyltransferase PlsX n=1 Tax=Pseudomonas sp. LTJR-52 TaxID=2479392 RepID=UPI000EFABA36|nr:phosphate acyltransferase PlsX [Pseudomonas sp. LTJR-52]AYN95128.1 phosphate acyltransferase PlsX [Pseudomonas sp. LTJR-52]
MSSPVIAIDAMGGDFGPRCIVPACISFLASHPAVTLILVGDPDVIQGHVGQSSFDDSRLRIHVATQAVDMAEKPSYALRNKPDSSMKVALGLVASGEADACVSAGNTGALMAFARQTLDTLPWIERPAIYTHLPVMGRQCVLVDLGANLDCSALNLYQFACLGAAAAKAKGIHKPRVALLNVGVEPTKGNSVVQQASILLEKCRRLNYIGFIEANALFRSEADVVVCDGFAGNVLLKGSEGLVSMLFKQLEGAPVFLRLLAAPLLYRLRKDMMPARHNGAGFLGLRGLVIKSHGSADEFGFQRAIEQAVQAVELRLDALIKANFLDLYEDSVPKCD